MDYRVPVYHGLLSKQFLDEQRMSTTFNEESFARESMSIWTGQSKDSWLSNKQLIAHRKLLKCEREAQKNINNPDVYYNMACDIGRYQANSAITIMKVLPSKTGAWKKKLVYIEIINGESLIDQATKIKEIIERFHPREVVIDGNGLGSGLIDAMVRPSFNPKTGKTYPEYYVMNDDNYLPPGRKTPPEKPDPDNRIIIYNLKAGAGNDSEIHANFFAQITSGNVDFLANERVVKTKLLATKKGQKMSLYDRREFLLPYEMTSRLMDEINNLKLKPTGVQNQIKVEQISRSMPKDRFSSVEYNLWRIKFYEDASIKKSKKITGVKDLIRFTPKRGVKH